ncbi:MAG: gfo/Idh/MocA family oxidoreductase [Bacteroidetes bacterium]|nr:gfo/Idh/MocA family oxidoreductase [Bacteroidota bacterium]
MEKLGWGVLGSARIARKKVMPALMGASTGRLVALASRDLARAEAGLAEALAEAAQRGIYPDQRPMACGSYEELLANPQVDAVYLPLPNSEHVAWAIRALEAGKHVLLEKPGVKSGEEALQLQAAASRYPKLLVSEGLMFRHHPQWDLALNWIRDGRIGALRSVQIQFSFYSEDPTNIRNRKETGGGALLDLGCYAIAASRLIFGAEASALRAVQTFNQAGVDVQTRAEMRFDPLAGAEAASRAFWSTDIRAAYFQRLDISGTEGRIFMERPFSPVFHEGVRPVLFGQAGNLVLDPEPLRADHFTLQADRFSLAVQGRGLLVPEDGLPDWAIQAHYMDAVRQSANADTWVALLP